jgi:hypothetical protein
MLVLICICASGAANHVVVTCVASMSMNVWYTIKLSSLLLILLLLAEACSCVPGDC